MMFEIRWSPQAISFLDEIQKNISKRILKKLDKIKKNPFRYLKHYEGDEGYKLRIGSYRMIIDIDFREKILWIGVFDKRGRIYKR